MALEFDNQTNMQQFRSRVILGQAERPKILDIVLKTGIVKTETAAANVLIALTVIVFGLSIFIFTRTYSQPETKQIPVYSLDEVNSSIIQQ